MSHPTDSELVSSARRGDAEAWGQLVHRHYGLVYGIALARLGNVEAAEDAAQEVFLRLFMRLGELRDTGSFPAWASRAARNLAVNWKRDGRRRSELLPLVAPKEGIMPDTPDPRPDPREQAQRAEHERLVREMLETLPPEERELVVLHFIEGWSQRELARRLGLNVSTVSRRLAASLEQMRARFEGTMAEALRPDPRTRSRAAARAGALASVYLGLPESGRAALKASAPFAEGNAAVTAAAAGGTAATTTYSIIQGIALMQAKKLIIGAAAVALLATGAVIWTTSGERDAGSGQVEPSGREEAAQTATSTGSPRPVDWPPAAAIAPDDAEAAFHAAEADGLEEAEVLDDGEGAVTLVVRGRVLTPERRPIEGAEVRLSKLRSRAPTGLAGHGHPMIAEEDVEARTYTNEDGRYELRSRRGLPVQVLGMAPGRGARAESVGREHAALQPLPDGGSVVYHDITLEDVPPLSGRLVDAADNPVADAPVLAVPQGVEWARLGRAEFRVRTDGDGTFRFDSLTGYSVQLEARPEGMALARQTVQLPATEEVILTVPGEGGSISGIVVDWQGEPVAGAAVTLGNALPPSWANTNPVVFEELSAGDGTFRFDVIPPDSYLLTAEAPDGRRILTRENEPFHPLSLKEGEEMAGIELRLFDGYTVTGTVIDVVTEEPVPGAEVFVRAYSDGVRIRSATDPEGAYRLENVPSFGSATGLLLEAAKAGYVYQQNTRRWSPQAHPEPGKREYTVDLELRPVVEWRGRVLTPDGWPAARARVFTEGGRGAFAYTDADGSFAVPVATMGKRQLRVLANGHPPTYSEPVEIEIEPPPALEITLDPGATVVLRVESESGEPLPGIYAGMMIRTYAEGWSSASRSESGTTGEGGTIVYTEIPTEGHPIAFDLRRQSIDFWASPGEELDEVAESDVVFQPGETREVVLTIPDATEGTEAIAGVVVGPDGAPLPNTHVTVTPTYRRVTTDARGAFRFANLPPGEYNLSLHHMEHGHHDEHGIQAGTEDLRVVMESGHVMVTLLVFDTETGLPIENGSATLEGWGGRPVTGIGDVPGAVRFPRVHRTAGSNARFVVTAHGYMRRSVPLPETTPGEDEYIVEVRLLPAQ